MVKKVNTKEKIINTANEMIWQNNFNGVSVDDICKNAGVNKGSFYHYFKSKNELAANLMVEHFEEIKSELDHIFSPALKPMDRLQLLCTKVYDKQKELYDEIGHVCGCPFVTLGSEIACQNEEIRSTIQDKLEYHKLYYRAMINDMIQNKIVDKKIDVEDAAENISSLIIGKLALARINNNLDTLENGLLTGLKNLLNIKETK